ncbi:MAG: hypothetical protein OEY01_03525 [Desulfobulbaceae bacterium]|nr:hypothetical protein [Desulfobulbaceae bacterium]
MKITDITERTFDEAFDLYMDGLPSYGKHSLPSFKSRLEDTIHLQPVHIQKAIAKGFASGEIKGAIPYPRTREFFFRKAGVDYTEKFFSEVHKEEGFEGFENREPVLMTKDEKLFMPFVEGLGVASLAKLIRWAYENH